MRLFKDPFHELFHEVFGAWLMKKGFKNITIKSRVYERLSAMKQKNESFSDLFERLIQRSNLDTLRGLRGSVEFENKDELLEDINKKIREQRYGLS